MKTNRKKYKIVVLLDLKKSSSTTLTSAVGLAKMINGMVEVFHVKKPLEIVDSENQLSAMRTINNKHMVTEKEMQHLISPISKEFGVQISYSYAFGNVKNEIDAFIKEQKPAIVVLGKRKARPFNLIGDGIVDFVLKNHDGVVMIASDKNALVPNKELSFSTINSLEPSFNLEFAEDLMKHSQKSLKSFKIIKNSASASNLSKFKDERTIEYIFEHNDGTIKNISNYLSKDNINLLSIDRAWKYSEDLQNLKMPDINSIISELDVTLLVSGKEKFHMSNHN